jgi:hypothetical protein
MTESVQFRELLVALTRVEEKLNGVNARLDKLNGTVQDIIADITAIKVQADKHPYECKYGPKISEIERRLQTGDFHGSLGVEKELQDYHLSEASKLATKATVRNMLTEVRPFIYAAIMTFLILAALHFSEIWARKP